MDQMTIWHCIPKRLEDAVEFVTYRASYGNSFNDSDKYWIYLNEGWVAYDGGEDCRTIHENSIKALKAAIKTIRPMEV